MRGANAAVHIHDVVASYPLQTVPGLGRYAWRSLLLKGAKVVGRHPSLNDYLAFLKEVKVGNGGEVLTAYDDHLYDVVLGDRNLQREIDRLLCVEDRTLRLFAITENDEKFLRLTGWQKKSEVFAPPLQLSLRANDKAFLRRLAVEKGIGNIFPPFVIVATVDGLARAVERMSRVNDSDFIVVKATNLASGEGMTFTSEREKAIAFGRKLFANGQKEVIVEAGYDSDSYSMQWELRPRDFRFLGASAQIMSHHGKVHEGNIVSSSLRQLPGITEREIARMQGRAYPLIDWFWRQGHRGIFGIDFIKTKKERRHRLLLLESNARVTASTYPFSVGRQLADRGIVEYGIAARNCYPSSQMNWDGLVKFLGSDIFDGEKGILPYIPNCLPEKVGLMAIAPDAPAAEDMLAHYHWALARNT
ncbi:MAG: hypothetical protein WC310_00325 [Patescibacteria group bacterium]|jgi:hypothetical protein